VADVAVRRIVAIRVAIGLVAASVLAAPIAAAAATHTVAIDGMQFVPAALTVRRGDTVRWINRDLVPHTATAAGRFDSRTLAPGASWSWVAARAGRIDYVCTLHPTMKATLVVP
jgi:plastocyanin